MKQIASTQGMTLKLLSERIGITEQGFHGYVKKNTMPINKLEMIAEELNVHLVSLFGIELKDNGFREKYYELLEKYNICLEEKEALRVNHKKSTPLSKPQHKS